MDVEFTRHARNEMRLYRISEQDALATLERPDTRMTGGDGKPNALKALNGRLLRAVYIEERRKVIRITIHPKD